MSTISIETPRTSLIQEGITTAGITIEHAISTVLEFKDTLMHAVGIVICESYKFISTRAVWLKDTLIVKVESLLKYLNSEEGKINALESALLGAAGAIGIALLIAALAGAGFSTVDSFSKIVAETEAASATDSYAIVQTLNACNIPDCQLLQGPTTIQVKEPYDRAGLEVRRCPGGLNNDLLWILPPIKSATFVASVDAEGTWGVVTLEELHNRVNAIKLNGIPAGSVGFVSLTHGN